MQDQEKQQRFIQLRAQGWSYTRIAPELGVCKRTLINWSRKCQYEIQNQRAIELEALQQQFLATREERVRALGEHLRQVEEELKKRNIADIPTARLFTLADALRRQILRETGEVRFTSPIQEIPKDEYHEQVQDWSA